MPDVRRHRCRSKVRHPRRPNRLVSRPTDRRSPPRNQDQESYSATRRRTRCRSDLPKDQRASHRSHGHAPGSAIHRRTRSRHLRGNQPGAVWIGARVRCGWVTRRRARCHLNLPTGLAGANRGRGSAARPRLRRPVQLPGSRPCVPRLQQPRRSRQFDGSSLPGVGASPTPESRRQPRRRPDRPTDQQPSHPTYRRGYDAPRRQCHRRKKHHRRENHPCQKRRRRENHRRAESHRGENRRHQPNRRHARRCVQPGRDCVGRNLGWVVGRCRKAL